MKKKMAIVLGAAILLLAGFMVSGTGAVDWLVRRDQAQGVGQVDVSIGAALVLGQNVDFTVELTDSGDVVVGKGIVTLEANSSRESRICFEGLADGEYTLRVSAKGFAAYKQKIVLAGRAYAVNLTTGFLGGVNYAAGASHPGVLQIGDVTGDGRADDADKTALVNAIDRGDAAAAGDLNGDGEVNLVDLEYLARGYSDGRDMTAYVEQFVPAAVITARQGANTVIADGSAGLEDLLRSQGSVVLMPADGGAISENNPVSLEFDFDAQGDTAAVDGIIFAAGMENAVTKAVIAVSYTENGVDYEEKIPLAEGVDFLLENTRIRAERDGSGNIRLHLGSQVAVKKVTFTIMGTKSSNLAEISKVEFVNGMEERIPAPQMDVPENLTASVGSERITLTWDPCVNITGYEIMIEKDGIQETVLAAKNAVDITSFGGKGLENYQEYRLSVQSVNGTWRSGYCGAVTATPIPNGKPDKPDGVSARGEFRSIVVSWKDMKDTLTYNLFYKESSESDYRKIEGIETNSYTINDLKDLTEYTVYVTGVNEFGESSPSLPASALTKDSNPAMMPKYHLINTGEEGEKGAHIVNAVMFGGTMKDSPLDTEGESAWGTVDHTPSSYYLKETWDDGGYNPVGGNLNARNGLLYEFDEVYKLDTFAFYDATSYDTGYTYLKLCYWDESGTRVDVKGISMQRKTDKENRSYYVVKLPQPVFAKKIQFGIARGVASGHITVAEVYFYYYDELLEEIMALYQDDLHTVLRGDVTQAAIDALRVKVNTIDEISGEYHPDRELLELELKTAEAILNDKALRASVEIHSGISTNDTGRGFGGLNAWQPLGIAAGAQEEIMVYVGHNTKHTGDNADLQLVATQYHSESGGVGTVVAGLKVGPNKITVPKISSTAGIELGGALYVQYTGKNSNDRYAVRVSGGVQVPRLDLYHVTDSAERLARTKAYVEELQAYVAQIEAKHSEFHQNSSNNLVKFDYDAQNCILGAGDILLDTMMLSLPVQQIWSGSGEGSVDDKARKILNSMDAMECMMHLFYQHKGLNAGAADVLNQIPKGHLNIRYQRMFAGAFMYAAGNHIGIEWPEAAGMMGGEPVVADGDGRYQSGRLFGWGIAHEIGHCINQGAYAVAEITNNYFAVLAQARDDNSTVRFDYNKVYEKVTSGAKGRASNVFTQLGMYWQLHLAYDRGYNYKTYENYEEQLGNLFFARVDTYARNTAKAPAPGGISLTLAGDRDQDLMRLGCAAAQKDILEFFERWGMTPDEATRSYAGQFPKETRAICYANDDARVYSLQGGGSALGTSGTVQAVSDGTGASINAGAGSQIDFTLGSQGIPEADVLGYEIVRCTVSGGKTTKEAVGFATGSSFSDTVYMNNRVVWYEVTVIDKYLNRSAAKVLSPLKVEHDGSLDKTFWTVSTENLKAADEQGGTGDMDSPCEPEKEDPVLKAIDGDISTVYNAAAEGNASITLEFNRTLTVAGFKFRSGDGSTGGEYEIQVLCGDSWITAASGNFGQEGTVFFANDDGKYVSTYSAQAAKLILKTAAGSQVSIAELDVLGPTSDNVDFRRTQDGAAAIGRLAAAYRYGAEEDQVIPEGSIVFTGAYKGNPAYNVVILYDQNGNIVGGLDGEGNLKAQQIIMADVPDEGDICNVSDGTWIYWIEPDQQADLSEIAKVRAELYRVNKAETNEGQRLVSDSLFEAVPETLPDITLEGGGL